MRTFISVVLASLVLCSCSQGQQTKRAEPKLIGTCEGCEAVFEYGDRKLSSVDTLPGFDEVGERIKVTGTIYQPDGKTSASDVVLYVYHTDQRGIYATKGDETGWGKRHGYIRGWMKTGRDGRYTFYTLKPGTYPSRSAPAHIHPIILEPDGKYYWIDEYLFEGDTLLTQEQRSPESPRGGKSGVLTLKKEGNFWISNRDIILGKNISGY